MRHDVSFLAACCDRRIARAHSVTAEPRSKPRTGSFPPQFFTANLCEPLPKVRPGLLFLIFLCCCCLRRARKVISTIHFFVVAYDNDPIENEADAVKGILAELMFGCECPTPDRCRARYIEALSVSPCNLSREFDDRQMVP